MQNDGETAVGWAKERKRRAHHLSPIRVASGGHASLCPPYEAVSERTDRKIAQPQIREAAFFPDPEQRPVQRRPQQIVALADGDADTFAEKAALDKGPAGEGAAFAGIGTVDPERQRDRVAEDEV